MTAERPHSAAASSATAILHGPVTGDEERPCSVRLARAACDDAANWEAAAQLRRDHPRWVVIWAARKGEYQARPLFRATPRMVAAATPAELTAQMSQVRQPARTRRR